MKALVWQGTFLSSAMVRGLKRMSVKTPVSRHVIIPFLRMAPKNAIVRSHSIHSVKKHLQLPVFVRKNFEAQGFYNM